jgi:probable HAF family extracellular repeat protein
LNHLWQSTVFAALAGALTLVFRRNNAAIRHQIWLTASLKFLLPFSLLVSLGDFIHWRPTPSPQEMLPVGDAPSSVPVSSAPGSEISSAIRAFGEPFASVASPKDAASESGSRPWFSIVRVAFVLWLGGVLFQLFSWLRQWFSVRARLRAATPLELDVPALIPAVSSSTSIEPSVFGIFRPVLLLPERITEELNSSQIESILLHESAHVSRHDNLWAALHMVVESLFWFHPMVWWIGKRMAEQRERACDEEVLRGFAEPEVYAEAILNVCKLHLKTPMACMAGVASSNLRERVEGIMNHRQPQNLNIGRKLMLFGAALVALCGPILVGMTEARQTGQREESFVYSGVDVPGSTSTTARSINNLGQIVGSFVDSTGTHAFLFNNGKFSTIDVPGSAWTIATGINNAGQIVGGYGTGGETGNHGFLVSNGAFSTFDVPGSLDTIAYGINNKGQIVGTYLGTDNFRHGFRLSGGNYALVEVPNSRAGSARSVNDAGQIVGLSGFSAAAIGFVFSDGSYSKVELSPNTYVEAIALNNLGDIAGQEGGPQPPFRGFIRNGTERSAIELPGAPFSWNVQGINDLGQVVGEFSDRVGRTHGYLATPTALGSPRINPDQPPIRITDLNTGPSLPVPAGSATSPGLRGSQSESGIAVASVSARGSLNRGGTETLSAALHRVANGIVQAIGRTRPGNAERIRHLEIARAAAERALANAEGAVSSRGVTASQPKARVFQLPDNLQGVDPGLGITYTNLNMVTEAVARSTVGNRDLIYRDIEIISEELIAALVAARDFSLAGRGRGDRGLVPSAEIRGGKNAVAGGPNNLLSRIEITDRSTTGAWALEEGGVTVGPDNWARLCLPWRGIAGDYDIFVEFTRSQGNEGFGLLLTPGPALDKRFLFQLSAVGNQWVQINGPSDALKARVAMPFGPNGTRHSLRVRVLRDAVEAYLDGNEIFRYSTDYSDFQRQDWGFGGCAFGLVSWFNVITFHHIEVRG